MSYFISRVHKLEVHLVKFRQSFLVKRYVEVFEYKIQLINFNLGKS